MSFIHTESYAWG